MPDFRKVTDDFAVSPQIEPENVAEAAAQGFLLIINNRPDGEAPGQPPGEAISAAAQAAGIGYLHAPVVGRPAPEQAQRMRDAMTQTKGKVLAFCRSGTRSINAWAMGEAAAGARSREELLRLGRAAGYDLSGVLGD